MNPLGAFGVEVNQIVVLAHGAQCIAWNEIQLPCLQARMCQ
jgi:hypothetical protein